MRLFVSFIYIVTATSVFAMSPSDNHTKTQKERRTGELTIVKKGVTIKELKSAAQKSKKEVCKSLKKGKDSKNFTLYAKELDGKTILFAHRYDPACKDPKVLAWPKEITDKAKGHPEAKSRQDGEKKWLDMELICHLPAAADKKPTGQIKRYGLITGLKKDKEEFYRTLHQTVWPGVIAQIRKSNIRHWTTWCVELGDKLYLVSYYEYIGSDEKGDGEAMGKDPVTLRWWKLTDACQERLPEMKGKGIWAGMDELLHVE